MVEGIWRPFGRLDDDGAGELQRLLERRRNGKRRDLEVTVQQVGGAVGTRLRQPPQAEHFLPAVLKAEDLPVAAAAAAVATDHPSLLPCNG